MRVLRLCFGLSSCDFVFIGKMTVVIHGIKRKYIYIYIYI